MKRNRAIATRLLEYIEDEDYDGSGLFRSVLQERFYEDHKFQLNHEACLCLVEYHLDLLVTAQFLTLTPERDNRDLDSFGLTWSGHDFLGKS